MTDTKRTNAVFRDRISRDVILEILGLHFLDATLVADLTFGKGAFWFDKEARSLVSLDKRPRYGCQIAADSRHVPLRTGAVDVAIFDPPHQHGISKTTTLKHQDDYDRMAFAA